MSICTTLPPRAVARRGWARTPVVTPARGVALVIALGVPLVLAGCAGAPPVEAGAAAPAPCDLVCRFLRLLDLAGPEAVPPAPAAKPARSKPAHAAVRSSAQGVARAAVHPRPGAPARLPVPAATAASGASRAASAKGAPTSVTLALPPTRPAPHRPRPAHATAALAPLPDPAAAPVLRPLVEPAAAAAPGPSASSLPVAAALPAPGPFDAAPLPGSPGITPPWFQPWRGPGAP